jgi:hypothetical protein
MAQRISIGFHASPPLALRVSGAELSKLQSSALGSDEWLDLDTEDGSVKLALKHVLWVRVDNDDQRVGFGLGG